MRLLVKKKYFMIVAAAAVVVVIDVEATIVVTANQRFIRIILVLVPEH